MEGLVKLLGLVAQFALGAERGGQQPPRIIVAIACGVGISLAAFGAVGCFIAALWVGLLPALGPVGAPLVCAGVLLLICVILALFAFFSSRRRSPPPIAALSDAFQGFDPGPFLRQHKFDLLIGALLLGLMTGVARSRGTRPPFNRR